MTDQPDPASGLAVAGYFQPPQGYFWRWAEGNEVVEWLNGTTITYREELVALLTGLAPTGLPPLGAVLLLLAACNSNWQNNSAEIGLLQGLLRGLPPGGPPDEELTFHLSVARRFLDIVRELPTELRQGVAKEHLLRQVVGGGTPSRLIPTSQAKQLANDLVNYTENALIQPETQLTRWQFRADLLCFDRAARRFPTVHGLELRLRTGLDQLPEPLAEIPTPPPAPESADLLAELAQDAQTAGLARLVPHLRAALLLPHTAPQASEQPLGGVADLSNRGPLDRLLLSELAQDDLSLLARLAHGEALYLRREAPPLPQPPPRVLLLDTTLLMWGLPRVAGLAAALALATPGNSAQPALAFALGSQAAQPLDLRSRAGVVAALGLLDPALHCGAALAAVLPTLPAPAEALLITDAQAARQPDFMAVLAAAPALLRFLLTVARSGELVLYELKGGRRTMLSTIQVDLERVLFDARRATQPTNAKVVLPAFMQEKIAPLFFPTLHVVPGPTTMLHDERRGAIGVDKNRRLLYWPSAAIGARELWPQVEEGNCCFGFGTDSQLLAYLLITSSAKVRKPLLMLYEVDLMQLTTHRVDLSHTLAPYIAWTTVEFVTGYFILAKAIANSDLLVDCKQHTLEKRPHYSLDKPVALPLLLPPPNFLNPGYSVLQRVSRLGISPTGWLTIENRQLVFTDKELMLDTRADTITTRPTARAGSVAQLTATPGIRCERLLWPDGSEAFVDGRGLLHLRSADNTLAEVTLVLAIDRPTAAWAADGTHCGSPYFTGLKTREAGSIPAAEFYQRYLQPFINHVLS